MDTKIILVRASSNIVSTSSLLNDSYAIRFAFFSSKSLFKNSNYGEKFLGLIAASGGSNIRRFSNGIRHHRRSFGIIHVTALRPCWWR
jgi:hypothetical protein